MIATFDWIRRVQRDVVLRDKIRKIILAKQTGNFRVMGSYRLSFNGSEETVIVSPVSPDASFAAKIIPMRLRYRAVIRMMNGEWDNIEPGDIMPVEVEHGEETLIDLL